MKFSDVRSLLELGHTVTFCPHGSSMEPYIKSGQRVTVVPCDEYCEGDIVLCSVKGKYLLHFIDKVMKVRHANNPRLKDIRYRICNAKRFVNGWTTRVYGKVQSDK